MTVIKDRHNKVSGTDSNPNSNSKDEIVIDKVDCLQRDFAGFKAFLIQHIDEKIDRAFRNFYHRNVNRKSKWGIALR